MRHLFYIFCFFLTCLGFAQSGPIFEQGKKMYKAEKYQQAIEQWNKIIDNGEHSASLYFNLGNAHYKMNNIGESIYYYEKALQISPNDRDIKNNLAFAQNATVDDIEPLPETIFSKWYGSLSGIFTYNGWARLSLLFSIGFVILFLVYYNSIVEGKKRLFFAGSIIFLVFLMVSFTMAFMIFDQAKNDQPAIIFSEKIDVRSEPNLGSEVSFSLHEGTKVQIISKDGDWARVEIPDGKDGWIPNLAFKEL